MHHTKTKADLGVAKTIADLMSKGIIPCIPLSEHQPYDLIAVLPNGKTLKLQVKYATLKKGKVEVKFRTCWVDRNRTHMRKYSESEFDYYAIYCPEKEKVLYVPNALDCPKIIRFEKSLNNQDKKVNWASDYHVIRSPQGLYATHLKQ